MITSFEEYLKKVDLELLFKKLGTADPETMAKTVTHFTVKEGKTRDKIVLSYFGEEGAQRIVQAISERLQTPTLPKNTRVLDVGAGSGFFTTKIAKRIKKAKFYAMDATPAMLLSISKENRGITPFLGVAENIEASIKEAKAYADIPAKFDAAFSTLMLHHSVQPEKVFASIKNVLSETGKVVVLDLCEHNFTEFKTEMQDVHLGFSLDYVRKTARRYFSSVEIGKIPGIGCTCSGRSAEIFVATMQNNAMTRVV